QQTKETVPSEDKRTTPERGSSYCGRGRLASSRRTPEHLGHPEYARSVSTPREDEQSSSCRLERLPRDGSPAPGVERRGHIREQFLSSILGPATRLPVLRFCALPTLTWIAARVESAQEVVLLCFRRVLRNGETPISQKEC